jgi:hypothetical protein
MATERQGKFLAKVLHRAESLSQLLQPYGTRYTGAIGLPEPPLDYAIWLLY